MAQVMVTYRVGVDNRRAVAYPACNSQVRQESELHSGRQTSYPRYPAVTPHLRAKGGNHYKEGGNIQQEDIKMESNKDVRGKDIERASLTDNKGYGV